MTVDGAEQMQCQKTDRPGVRVDRDPLAVVTAHHVLKFRSDAAEQLAVAFAVSYDVVDAAVDEGVVVGGKLLFRLVKGKAFEDAYMAFAKRGRRVNW